MLAPASSVRVASFLSFSLECREATEGGILRKLLTRSDYLAELRLHRIWPSR